MMSFEIDISNCQKTVAVDCHAIRAAILHALQIEHVASAVLSVSIVDNAAIRAINRDHLQHDYPTDVLSFQLGFETAEDSDDNDSDHDDSTSADEPQPTPSCQMFAAASLDAPASALRAAGAAIEGEIIASAEIAEDMASEGRWSTQDELTLYIIHGLLHICGYDDLMPEQQTIMRSRERVILNATGRHPVYAEDPRPLFPH